MSLVKIQRALEKGLKNMTPALDTAWENNPYTPTEGTPFQRAWMILAEPDDIELTGHMYIERGIFQVNLHYPAGKGSGAARARAQLIRDTFYHGASFSSDGIVVNVCGTPEVGPGLNEDDRYIVPVMIRFSSQITRS